MDSIQRTDTRHRRKANKRWEKLCILTLTSTALLPGVAWGEAKANPNSDAAPVRYARQRNFLSTRTAERRTRAPLRELLAYDVQKSFDRGIVEVGLQANVDRSP